MNDDLAIYYYWPTGGKMTVFPLFYQPGILPLLLVFKRFGEA